MVEDVTAEAQAQWDQFKSTLPASMLPYASSHSARVLVPTASALLAAQLFFSSPRFRALFTRAATFGRDASVFGAALYAAFTVYRELNTSMQSNNNSSSSSGGSGAAIAASPSTTSASSSASSPSSLLPSYALYRRVHAVSASAAASRPLLSSLHSLQLMLSWLRMRFQASRPLRHSTLALAAWLLWLTRNTDAMQSIRQYVKAKALQIGQGASEQANATQARHTASL